MTPTFTVIRAFFLRDALVDLSYRASLALELLDVGVGVAAFFYVSRVVGTDVPGGYDAFAFVLLGVAVNNAMTLALTCFAQSVKADQQEGTLKPMLLAPMAPASLVAVSAVYPLVRAALGAVFYLVAGVLLFGLRWPASNLPAAVVVLGVSLAAFAALGMMAAAFTMVFKRGDPLLWLFGALSWLLGGVFFPVSLLPPALQNVAALLPITHALEALRQTQLHSASLQDVSSHLVILGAIAVVGVPLSAALVGPAIAWGRRTGSLGHA